MLLTAMRRAVVAAAVVLGVTACGGHQTQRMMPMRALEHRIQQQALNRSGVVAKVSCPSDIPVQAGRVFHCLVRGGGQTFRLTVTIENDKGYVTWVASQ